MVHERDRPLDRGPPAGSFPEGSLSRARVWERRGAAPRLAPPGNGHADERDAGGIDDKRAGGPGEARRGRSAAPLFRKRIVSFGQQRRHLPGAPGLRALSAWPPRKPGAVTPERICGDVFGNARRYRRRAMLAVVYLL